MYHLYSPTGEFVGRTDSYRIALALEPQYHNHYVPSPDDVFGHLGTRDEDNTNTIPDTLDGGN